MTYFRGEDLWEENAAAGRSGGERSTFLCTDI